MISRGFARKLQRHTLRHQLADLRFIIDMSAVSPYASFAPSFASRLYNVETKVWAVWVKQHMCVAN